MRCKTLLFAISLFVAAVASSPIPAADFPVEGKGASGLPGERVFVELVYDYGTSFGAIVEDFALQYPQATLTFLPDASTIDMFGTERNLHEYADMLRVFAQDHFGIVLENTDPILPRTDRKGYALSFFTADGTPHVRSGFVHLRAAFDILPSTAPGDYIVSFGDRNVLVDELENEFGYPSALQNLTVTVLAVPEPRIVLMLIPGVVLVGWYARRQARRT